MWSLCKRVNQRSPDYRIVWGLFVFLGCCLSLSVLGGCSSKQSVTAADPKSAEGQFDQSETALTTAHLSTTDAKDKAIIVVAYNDATDTSATIKYTPEARTVLPGASLMGWSYSVDRGKTWKYGGKVLPPENWAALWGDPAITASGHDPDIVFMSNLAIPSSKMPPNGISGPVNDYMGGACIARSTDGGKHFQVYQMLTNQNHFYDGGSMAVSPKWGDIFAAFVDAEDGVNQIDIWHAPNVNAPFERLPNPFPGMKMYSHPRIRISPYADNTLFVAAQASDWVLYMTRWHGQYWDPPVAVSNGPVELYPNTKFTTGTVLRTGPQFSFDIGAASTEDLRDAIRVMYTQRDAKTNHLFVTSTHGKLDLSKFWPAPEWGTTPGYLNTPGDQFNPNVRAFLGPNNFQPAWKATFMNRNPKAMDKVDLEQGNLGYLSDGTRIYVPLYAIKGIPVCPDLRPACNSSGWDDPSGHYCGGYWGDYDDLAIIGFDSSGVAQFLRTVSDSSLGCQSRWEYTSHHVHVSAASFY